MHTTLGIAASIILLALGSVAVFGLESSLMGVDAAVAGTVVMLAGLTSLTLVTLVWAARGPGAVQDGRAVPPRPRRPHHDHTHRT